MTTRNLFSGREGRALLFIDQHGEPIKAASLKELREKAGGGRVSKQYVDKKDGRTAHNGYVIGRRWFTAFDWHEVEA